MPSNRPKLIKYVLNAIVELGDQNGSPLTSIIDLVRTNIAIDDVKPRPHQIAVHTRRALQMAIEEGLVMETSRGRYKIVIDDDEDNFIPRIRPTVCSKQRQRHPNKHQISPATEKCTKSAKDNIDQQFYDDCTKDDVAEDKTRTTDIQGTFCARCGGRKRSCGQRRCRRQVKPCRRRSRPCKPRSGCGRSGGRSCGECRPPPIPRTPCTPPTPRQPCPPNPPSAPKTPCDYFENEGFDRTNPEEDQYIPKAKRSRLSNHIICRRSSSDALSRNNENELALGSNPIIDPDENEAPNRKLYFGPGSSLDQTPIANSPDAEQMETADPSSGNDKTQEMIYDYTS